MIFTTKVTSYNDLHCCILKSRDDIKYNVMSNDIAALYMGVIPLDILSLFFFIQIN